MGKDVKDKKSGSIIVKLLLVILSWIVLLFVLEAMGVIVTVNRVSMISKYIEYLGSSKYFFSIFFICLIITSICLYKSLTEEDQNFQKIMYWNSLADTFIILFFATGVIYTAIGMQTSFETTLTGFDTKMAGSMNPMKILSNLLDTGLLTALFTTIVGGVLGYGCRLIKYLLFGYKLLNAKKTNDSKSFEQVMERLDSIESSLRKNS